MLGRPSDALHAFWVSNLRPVLDAVLTSGKQHGSGHAKAAMRLRGSANVTRLIERLFRRADCTRAGDASQGWRAIEDELRLSGAQVDTRRQHRPNSVSIK